MKRIVSLTLALLLALCVWTGTAAALYKGASYVEDRIDLFDTATEASLTARCKELSAQYNTNCLILTTGSLDVEGYDDLSDFSDYEFENVIMAYADEYLESVIGVGDEYNGIVLVLYVNENNAYDRGYWISTQGTELERFRYDMSEIMGTVKSKLSDRDWSGAATSFLDCVGYIEQDGSLPTPPKGPLPLVGTAVCLIVGFLIALIVVLVQKGKLKNIRTASSADTYLKEDSVNIRSCNAVFVRSSVTRTKRESSSSSSGGGSHTSSSGTHHGGGGGRF